MADIRLLLEAKRRGLPLKPEEETTLKTFAAQELERRKAQTTQPVEDSQGLVQRDNLGQLFIEPARASPQEILPDDSFITKAAKTVGNTIGAVDDAIPGPEMVLGGLRNALVGGLTLPADIVSYMGSDVYQPVAEAIRENIPEFKQKNDLGELGQTITQYAVPGAKGARAGVGALNAAGKALPAIARNTPGIVKKAAKGFAALTGAAAGDAVVTDAENASTLGDLFGGPTAIRPDDQPLAKRAKVGVETFIAEPIVRAGISTGKLVGKGVKRVGQSIEPFTKKGQERVAREYIQSQVSNPEKAIENIDRTEKMINPEEGFRPLTGDASNDPGLIAAQRGIVNTTKRGSDAEGAPGEQILERAVSNNEAVAKQFENLTQPSKEGDPSLLKTTAQTQQQEILSGPQAKLEDVNSRLTKLDEDMRAAAANLAANKGRKTAASEQIDQQIRNLDSEMTAAKNELYQSADPDGTLRRPADDLIEEIDAIKLEEGQDPSSLPSQLIDDIKRLGGDEPIDAVGGGDIPNPAPATSPNDGTVSFRYLVNMRQRVSDEIAKARAAGEGVKVKNLVKIKETINGQIEGFADSLTPEMKDAAIKLKQAQDYYSEQFAPRFKQGEGGRLRKAMKSGQPGAAPPSATAGRFLSPGTGSKERATDLNRLVGQGNPATREYLISDLADNVTDGQAINPARLDRWIEKNREVLKANPAVQKEIMQLKNRVASGSKARMQIDDDLKKATEGVKKTEQEIKDSALRLFLDFDEPLDAVSKIMTGSNKAKKMAQAVAMAKKDPSGKALEGLRDTVKLWGRKNMTQSAESLGGRPLVSSAKLNAAAKDPGVLEALSILYKDRPQDLRVLRKIRANLNVLSRSQRVQGTAGAASEPIRQQANEFRTLIASAVGITQGRGVFQIGRWVQQLTGLDPEPIIEQLVVDAFLDPQLAKTMLMTPTEKNLPMIQKDLKTYISNNLLVGQNEKQQEKNKREKE